jgi:D-arabinose 5-phosphate isomerase GutQ
MAIWEIYAKYVQLYCTSLKTRQYPNQH